MRSIELTLSQSFTSKWNLAPTRDGTMTSNDSSHTGESVLRNQRRLPYTRESNLLLLGIRLENFGAIEVELDIWLLIRLSQDVD